MMDKIQALELLGISQEDSTDANIIRMRYQRLVKRYSPSDFPEMALKVHQAYQALQQSDADLYINYLKNNQIDLTSLIQTLPRTPNSAKSDLEHLFRNTVDVWCNQRSDEDIDIMKDLESFFKMAFQGI
jgi:hypothetical protein